MALRNVQWPPAQYTASPAIKNETALAPRVTTMACRHPIELHDPQSDIFEDAAHYNNPNLRIDFLHPGYEQPHNVLFTLHGFDYENGGIHHNTALVACGIIAGNQWHGYFTESRGGPPILAARDETLRGKSYYFYLPPLNARNSTSRATTPPLFVFC
jgi:hypothetical protein